MQAWRAFLEAYNQIIRRLERELADEAGLPLSWYDALVQLQEAGGTMRVGMLADQMLISRSATTRFVDRLEREGLIRRQVCDEDRRGMEVLLTDKGFKTLQSAAPTHMRGIDEHFLSKLSSEDAATLRTLMEKVSTYS